MPAGSGGSCMPCAQPLAAAPPKGGSGGGMVRGRFDPNTPIDRGLYAAGNRIKGK